MELIDKQQLQEIEESLSKATPGPWTNLITRVYPTSSRRYAPDEICVANSVQNAHLIAKSPEYIALLLGVIHSAQEEIAELRRIAKQCGNYAEQRNKMHARALQAEQEIERLKRQVRKFSELSSHNHTLAATYERERDAHFSTIVDLKYTLRQIIGDFTPAEFVTEIVQNQDEFKRTLNDNERLTEERNALLDTLKWYADEGNWKGNISYYRSNATDDWGSRARSIISKLEKSQKLVVNKLDEGNTGAPPAEEIDERDLQRGYRRGYDFRGTDNRE